MSLWDVMKKDRGIDPKYRKIKKVLDKRIARIPEQFNQLDMLTFLYQDDIDVSMSITSRSDGKTTGAGAGLFELGVECGYKTIIILPTDYVQRGMTDDIIETVGIYTDYNPQEILIRKRKFATELTYKGHTIMALCNLDDAMELKHNKEFMSQFRLFWFDEFIRFSNSYRPDEVLRYQTLFDTMDKDFNSPYPVKALFTGNPLNFDSPFFAEWDLYKVLAEHELNTSKVYNMEIEDVDNVFNVNIMLEIRKNIEVNKMKAKQIFRDRSGSNSGEFQFNNWHIARPTFHENYSHTIVKVDDMNYIYVYQQDGRIFLQVKAYAKDPALCVNLADIDDNCAYMPDTFRKPKYKNYFINGVYWFMDSYSKNTIINTLNLTDVNFMKVIDYSGEHATLSDTDRQKLAEMESLTLLIENKFKEAYLR